MKKAMSILPQIVSPILLIGISAAFFFLSATQKPVQRDMSLPAARMSPVNSDPVTNATLAAVSDTEIVLVSGTRLFFHDKTGKPILDVSIPMPVTAISAGNEQEFFVAAGSAIYRLVDHVIVKSMEASQDSLISALVLHNDSLFAADAGNRKVFVYSLDLQLKKIISPDADHPLNLPSPFFDIAVSEDESVWMTNTGNHRIDIYSKNGIFSQSLVPSSADEFTGCCNPVHIMILNDTRYITYEKGINRLRLYSPGKGILRELFTDMLLQRNVTIDDICYNQGTLYILAGAFIYSMEIS